MALALRMATFVIRENFDKLSPARALKDLDPYWTSITLDAQSMKHHILAVKIQGEFDIFNGHAVQHATVDALALIHTDGIPKEIALKGSMHAIPNITVDISMEWRIAP